MRVWHSGADKLITSTYHGGGIADSGNCVGIVVDDFGFVMVVSTVALVQLR